MLKEYSELLEPLGSTRHLASRAVWQAVGASWIGDQSSMFSPLFGWAGLWGDLGFLGVAVYAYLAVVVWRYICVDDISKLILLSVFVFGLIFSQIEEPGYMISVAMLIGLQWQEAQGNNYQKNRGNTKSGFQNSFLSNSRGAPKQRVWSKN